MLQTIQDTVLKHYYDPTFHGQDMRAHFRAAEDEIEKAEHLGQAFTAIFEALEYLDDSHTYFVPPTRPISIRYGYRYEMVGDACFVTAVQPGTDAAKKLKPGDRILTMEGFRPTRDSLWKLHYFFGVLSPRGGLHLAVRHVDGSQETLEVNAAVEELARVTNTAEEGNFQVQSREYSYKSEYVEFGDALIIWKIGSFIWNQDELDRTLDHMRKYQALILDLRGNPGGSTDTLERVVGALLDHDVTIATRVGRKEDLKPLEAKTRGSHAFAGKLFVLVDSQSASAAELLARVVQLEHRGMVLGDRSYGGVMEAQRYPFRLGADVKIFYGLSLTDANLIMSDGKSLEHTGVIPDQVILPSAADLAVGNDPVLSKAAELAANNTLDPVAAGKLFPVEWTSPTITRTRTGIVNRPDSRPTRPRY
jgi:C-terminal processing protease CtpA/Prc